MIDMESTWRIDAGHSEVQFKVKHLAISNVSGVFNLFKGEVLSEKEDFDGATVHCVIDVSSLDTNNGQRDKDLKSEGFFDVQQFPEIVFDGLLKKKDDRYELAGELTIRETVRHIAMEAEFTGIGKGRFNDTRAGFEVTGKISRKDFGLSWNVLTEAGGFAIGEEIRLHFDIQLIRQ
jgi:polyisoprenoid-binding protein YceI